MKIFSKLIVALFFPVVTFSQVTDRIELNQVGFYPDAPKAAWNAPMVYLVNAIEALAGKVGYEEKK